VLPSSTFGREESCHVPQIVEVEIGKLSCLRRDSEPGLIREDLGVGRCAVGQVVRLGEGLHAPGVKSAG
jgi:hypothetical protein